MTFFFFFYDKIFFCQKKSAGKETNFGATVLAQAHFVRCNRNNKTRGATESPDYHIWFETLRGMVLQPFHWSSSTETPNQNHDKPIDDLTHHKKDCNFLSLISTDPGFLEPSTEWRTGAGFVARRTKTWRRTWAASGRKWRSNRKGFRKTSRWHSLRPTSMSVTPKAQFKPSRISLRSSTYAIFIFYLMPHLFCLKISKFWFYVFNFWFFFFFKVAFVEKVIGCLLIGSLCLCITFLCLCEVIRVRMEYVLSFSHIPFILLEKLS